MCGIVGVLGFTDRQLIERMKKSVAHRGPDQHGTHIGKNVMMGHRRLSILDVSEKGRQPMTNHEGTVVVFNGEIYNYKALRADLEKRGYRFESQSDTEVLVHGFAEWGHLLPEKLDGEYAFAAWNEDRRELLLARDPLGVVPLYYAKTPDGFFFASEPKAFFEFEDIRPQLNKKALEQYLTYRYAVAPTTLFEGIQKVRPGHFVSVQRKIQQKRFYQNPVHEIQVSQTEAQARIQRLFADAVKKRLQSDVPLGAYLSGGLDSSWIVGQMSAFTRPHTFSVAFGEKDDETPYVEEIVSHYDTNHTELNVDADRFDLLPQITWHLDAPAADIAALPTYLMAQATKRHATVVLTGDGGDEVFAGYPRYQRLLTADRIRKAPTFWTKAARAFLTQTTATRLSEAMHAKNRSELVNAYGAAFSENEKKKNGMPSTGIPTHLAEPFFNTPQSFLNQMMALDQATLLPDDYLMKVNKTSMAHAVEPRVPFLDVALVRFASTLPPSLKATWRKTKIIQKNAMKAMGIPSKILHRKKHGFNIPTASWLKQGLSDVAEQCFESLDDRKLMKKGVGKKVLERFDESPAYFTRQFWTLLGLEVWCQVYLDVDQPKKPQWRL